MLNPYFSSSYESVPDQTLTENLIIEAIQMYGIDVKYVPRTFVNYDALFGEDQNSAFSNFYTVECYVKSVDGFGGDGNFLSKFGLEIRDEVRLTISKKRFEAEVTANDAEISRPREGDLINLPTTVDKKGRLFEIAYVNYEEVYYQQGTLHTYELTCRVFEFSGETFSTGDSEIDDVMDYRVAEEFILTNGSGTYTVGETLTIGTGGVTGEVSSWDGDDLVLGIVGLNGDVNSGETITGQTSAAAYNVISDVGIEVQNENEDNDVLKDEAFDFLDDSENDPTLF